MAVLSTTLGRRSVALLVMAVLLACALPPLPTGSAVQSGGTGLEDSDRAGCHCHNLAPDAVVTLNLMGVPERYEPGQVYDLIITVAGGPPYDELATASGGFMVSCTNGTFAVPEGSDQVQVFNNGQSASHTLAGNKFRQWRVPWRAPGDDVGDAVFYLAANSVNGDGVETGELDAYNSLRTFSAFIGPPKMPKNVTEILVKAIEKASTDPEYKKFILSRGDNPGYLGPEDLFNECQKDRKIYRDTFEKAGLLKEK